VRLSVPLSLSLTCKTKDVPEWFTTPEKKFPDRGTGGAERRGWPRTRPAAYRDGVDRKAWPLGIRWSDLVTVAVVIAVVELNVVVGGGAGAAPLDALSYTIGAVIALPLLVHRRWPRAVLLITFGEMMLFYILHRRNISPAPLMFVPVYDTAVAGYLAWAIAVPAVIMVSGLFAVGLTGGMQPATLAANFLPSFAIFILAVALGEVVRSRRALAAETARRLTLADEEQRSEAARLVAEERLRIARELHDTVAHSMATITVQAGSALHVLSPAQDGAAREALLTIRETSKSALGRCAPSSASSGATRGPPRRRPPRGLAWTGCRNCARRSPPRARRSASASKASQGRCRRRSTTRPTGSCRSR
jgi:Histidine kinase